MQTASARLEDRYDRKRAQDLDDIKVLKQLAIEVKQAVASDLGRGTHSPPDLGKPDRGPEM